MIKDKFAFYLTQFCTFKVVKIIFESLCLITRRERSKYFLKGVFSGVSKGVNVKNLGTSPLAPFQPLPCELMRGVELKKDGGNDHAFKLCEKRIRRDKHNFYIRERKGYSSSVTFAISFIVTKLFKEKIF